MATPPEIEIKYQLDFKITPFEKPYGLGKIALPELCTMAIRGAQ